MFPFVSPVFHVGDVVFRRTAALTVIVLSPIFVDDTQVMSHAGAAREDMNILFLTLQRRHSVCRRCGNRAGAAREDTSVRSRSLQRVSAATAGLSTVRPRGV